MRFHLAFIPEMASCHSQIRIENNIFGRYNTDEIGANAPILNE